MLARPIDAAAPVAQRLVQRQFSVERRRSARTRPSAGMARRLLMRQTRRYLRRVRRWEATRALSGAPTAHEEKRSSQNGEDGIIATILERVGVTGGVFVEIGAADGEENCTRALAETGRWRGLWIEGDAERAARAESVGRGVGVTTVNAFVDRDNIVELVAGSGLVGPKSVDVLVIDVDGNDWYLWQALAEHYRPALVVTEVNGALGPWLDWVMPYDRAHEWHQDRYHGASLQAFDRLARRLGYRLVACDGAGVNAFWVQADLAAGFPAAGHVRAQYAPPSYAPPSGHPWCGSPAFDGVPLTVEELGEIRLERAEFVLRPKPGLANAVVVEVLNGTTHLIASGRLNPVRVTARWGMNPRPDDWAEPARGSLSGIVRPRGRGQAVVMLPPQTAAFATLDVVQDGVGWAHDSPSWEFVRVPAVPIRP